MNAIVFAAGRGTRLGPATDDTPKPLLPVGGEPLLDRCLEAVVAAGVDRLVLVVGYRAEQIVDAVGESYGGVPVTYAYQHERRGLAHAVRRAAEDGYGVSIPDSEPSDAFTRSARLPRDVMTVNGDNVFDDCALSRLRARHEDSNVDGTLLLDRRSRNEADVTAGCVVDDDGTIQSVESSLADSAPRNGSQFVAAGVQTHAFPALLEACLAIDRADSGEYELADALEVLVESGERYVGVELDGWHLNVNTPAVLERARRRFRP